LKREYYRGVGAADTCGELQQLKQQYEFALRVWGARQLAGLRRSERAAASASRGQVKNLAEKPFTCNMIARLDAMTGSSSTTKMREPGDT
jgi:hypothetical protein